MNPATTSLMPEGLEKLMTRQELRDLLEFLCAATTLTPEPTMSEPSLPRRRFLAATLGGLALGRAGRPTFGAAGARKYRYIDIHTHVGRYYWGKDLTLAGLLKLMDRHDIERACVLPLVSPESTVVPADQRRRPGRVPAHPDRIIPFCCVDPRTNSGNPNRAGRLDLRSMTEVLTRFRDLGARGFGEHQVGLPVRPPADDDRRTRRATGRAADPVPPRRHPGSTRLASPGSRRVFKSFPKLPLIGHAAGFWASISGDARPEDFGRYLRAQARVPPAAPSTG